MENIDDFRKIVFVTVDGVRSHLASEEDLIPALLSEPADEGGLPTVMAFPDAIPNAAAEEQFRHTILPLCLTQANAKFAALVLPTWFALVKIEPGQAVEVAERVMREKYDRYGPELASWPEHERNEGIVVEFSDGIEHETWTCVVNRHPGLSPTFGPWHEGSRHTYAGDLENNRGILVPAFAIAKQLRDKGIPMDGLRKILRVAPTPKYDFGKIT